MQKTFVYSWCALRPLLLVWLRGRDVSNYSERQLQSSSGFHDPVAAVTISIYFSELPG